MNAGEIKYTAGECEQISEFIRQMDSYANTEIVTSNNIGQAHLSANLAQKLWPDFRKQLVAKYNKLAATINADKFFDPNANDEEEFTADDAHPASTGG